MQYRIQDMAVFRNNDNCRSQSQKEYYFHHTPYAFVKGVGSFADFKAAQKRRNQCQSHKQSTYRHDIPFVFKHAEDKHSHRTRKSNQNKDMP